MEPRFEEIQHTADVAIRVRGADLAELFANAGYGMACLLAEPGRVQPACEETVELEAYDAETLLVSWLGELLYLSEREGCVYTEFEMRAASPTQLRAVVRGGPVATYRHAIKAVTFSNLAIRQTAVGYETTVVFDV